MRKDIKKKPVNVVERVAWLNERDPFHKWEVGEEVFCYHCEQVFKAEDVGEDHRDGLPECPNCRATPMDFWRESERP